MNQTKNIVITFEEARNRVIVEISKTDPYSPDLVLEINDEDTIEKEWGWVFFTILQHICEAETLRMQLPETHQ
jgi:hypothetical protein